MKKPVGIRLEEILIERAKKLAEKNKKNFKQPNNFNSLIEQAIAEFLEKNK
jgi:DNA-directed RNA polymerase subunit K/omega